MDWFENQMWNARAKLKSFAMHLYRNADDADDAVQDTMMRAITHRGSFVKGSNMEAWLFTILKNRFRALKRSGHSQRMTFTDDPRYADSTPAADNPERSLIAKEGLAAAFNLKPKLREALWLIGVMGLTYDDAADAADVCIGTIKSRTCRARMKLEEAI